MNILIMTIETTSSTLGVKSLNRRLERLNTIICIGLKIKRKLWLREQKQLPPMLRRMLLIDLAGERERREAQAANDNMKNVYNDLRKDGKTTHQEATGDKRFRYAAGQAAYKNLKYNKTPMGKAESFANAGRSILNRLIAKANKVKSAVDFHAYSDAEKAQRKAEREEQKKKNRNNIFSLKVGGKSAIEIKRNNKG